MEQNSVIGAHREQLADWSLSLYIRILALSRTLADECGQDLIEYALVVSLIALAATVSMNSVATAIATAFTGIGSKLGTYTS